MKRIYIITSLLAAFVLSSCTNFLVKEPVTSQSSEQLLATYIGLDNATAGAYSPLASNSWYGGTYYVLDADMRAGLASVPLDPNFQSGRTLAGFTMNYNENSTSGLWSYAYYVISAANNVLESLDNNSEQLLSSGLISESDLNHLRAECLFLRGLSHFDLLRVYSRNDQPELGIPIILITDKTSSEQPARNTIREVYDQIEKDLLEAEDLIGDYSRSGVTDANAVVNKWVIKALLARVYLYDATFSKSNEKYQLAADYATEVINSGKYKMWTAKEYSTVWGNSVGSGEVIFEVFGVKSNSYDAYWEAPTHMTNPSGYADVCASAAFVKSFEDGDVRGVTGVRDTKEEGAMFCTDPNEASGGELWPMKYPGKGLGDVTGTPDQNNTIVLRLSEMYIIRAEALATGNAVINGATALDDLNTIRTNRGLGAATSASVSSIWEEAKKEFCFEGFHWFNTARLATAGNSWAVITYGTDMEEASRRGPNIANYTNYWALPISKSERDVNPNLVQMPGF